MSTPRTLEEIDADIKEHVDALAILAQERNAFDPNPVVVKIG